MRGLLPADLLSQYPRLANLLERRVRRLPHSVRAEVIERAGSSAVPLIEIWTRLGCDRLYRYAVAPDELPGAPATAPSGALTFADTVFPLVEAGVRSAARLAATIAWANAFGEAAATPRAVAEVLRASGRLACAASPGGLFRGARLLAVVRHGGIAGCVVGPADVADALALTMTPSMRAALQRVGVPLKALDATRVDWSHRLGSGRLAKLRLAAVLPPPLSVLPQQWQLDDLVAAEGIMLTLPDAGELATELDALWLAQQAVLNAPLNGVPRVRSFGKPSGRIQGIREVADRHCASGWRGVFDAALRAVGWEPPPPGRVFLLEAPDAPAEAPAAPSDTEAKPELDAEEMRREFASVRAALESMVVGQELVDSLAVIALLHRRQMRAGPVLLTGPSGTGKSYLARALAVATGSHFYTIDATQLTETGYRGLNVPELLSAMYQAAGRRVEDLEHMVLVTEEVDKLRIGPDTDGVSYDKRWGMQSCLLTLLSGGEITFPAAGVDASVSTAGLLIVGTGAFSTASWSDERPPTTADLIAWGWQEELGERWVERILVPPRSARELVQIYTGETDGVAAVLQPAFAAVGCRLEVSQAACARVARLVASGQGGAGLRSGREILLAAARRLLLRALTEGSPAGTVFTVTPDDVMVPRTWRVR